MGYASTIPQKRQQHPGARPLNVVPPVRRGGAPWNLMHPHTFADHVFMWQDVPDFLVWSVLRNNFPAVRDNMRKAGADPEQLMSARALYDLILMMDPEEQAEVLNVPWINGQDQDQDKAYGLLREQVLAGVGTTKVLPLVAGLFGVVGSLLAVQGAEEQAESAERVAQMELASAAMARAERAERWERVKKWLIPAAIVAAVIAVIIIIRLRR